MKTTHENNLKTETKGLTPSQLAEGLIISVGEAKKVLGKDAKGLSDDEIAEHILLFADLAQTLIKYKHFAK